MFGKVLAMFSSLKYISIKVVLKMSIGEKKIREETQDLGKRKQKRVSKFHPS